MRCPVCGAKLYNNQICKYCKVTNEDVLSASNKKVKEYKENGNEDLIVYTNQIPKDINKLSLILFTIFLGFLGINHLLINRTKRGLYSLITSINTIIFFVLELTLDITVPWIAIAFELIYELVFFAMAINVIMWVFDIIGLIFKTFKVPVILPEERR